VSERVSDHGHPQSLRVRLPPLAVLVFTPD